MVPLLSYQEVLISRYDEYHTLFRSIFTLPPSVPMHFVPGNHDLPLGTTREFSPYARNRYAKYFSPPNSVLPIANHSLILLDAVGLVEEDYRRYAAETQFGEWDGVAGGVIEFVKGLGDGTSYQKIEGANDRSTAWAQDSNITYPTCST
jgi:hypothetical protein